MEPIFIIYEVFMMLFFMGSILSTNLGPISYLNAMIGGTILLPCDVTPPTNDDSSILVFFYRGENKTPIYSVDARESSLANGIHWSADYLGQRAFMNTHSKGSGLVLKDIQLSDRGLYRCRIDFGTSPTRNSRIQLRVIEPPRRLSIVSSWDGERKAGDVIGPYPEDSEISLSCQVIGGIPPPRVIWWHEGSLLDDVSEVKSEGVTRNTLHLPKLTREDLLKTITCQAVNSNLTAPLTKSVTIDLAYPPSAIKITSTQNNELRADMKISHKIPSTVTCISGETCPLECRVDGSRPPPLVTWKSNGRTLESEFETISSPPGAKERGSTRDSSSYSTLMLTALPEDDGAIISCRASSPALPEKAVEDNVTLNVLFSPKCSSRQMTSVGIGKSESANVTCRVDAYPTATIFRWAFNSSDELVDIPFDQQIEKNDSSNTITYQPRSLFDFGDLLCWASNSVGTMKEPCVIKILPIDKPEGVRGCKVSSNGTVPDGMVIVSCLPGWDGGLTQSKKHSSPKSTFMKFLPFVAILAAIVVVLTCVSIIACIARSKAAVRKESDRRQSIESRKASVQHSLPPDRGKDDLEDVDETAKQPSICEVNSIPPLPPPSISTHPMFINEKFKGNRTLENAPLEYLNCERKIPKETSV